MVGKSGPSFCQGLHTKNGLGLLLAHGHGPVGLAKPYLIFYPLQICMIYLDTIYLYLGLSSVAKCFQPKV